MGNTIIATGRYDDKRIYLLSTNGNRNQIELYDGEKKTSLISWIGAEVSGGTFYKGVFACTTNESLLYVVENREVRKISLKPYLLNAVGFTDEQTLVGAGNKGRIYSIKLTSETIVEEKLSKYGVSKPGRDFISVVGVEHEKLLLGKKQLLIELRDGCVRDIGASASGEAFYFSAVRGNGSVWVAGLGGPKPILVHYKNDTVTVYDSPTKTQRAPVIKLYRDNLIVGSRNIFLGTPSNWTQIHDFGEDTLIDIVSLPKNPQELFCIGYTGKIDKLLLGN